MRRAQRFGEADNAFGFRHTNISLFKVNHLRKNYKVDGKWNTVKIL